ncbi:hypothetical protein [Streptomyces sp. NPDC059802]|uniref:hypothetical protein n=1 Tax=Streptomyces sp. NPDC059802 TaxID=3346952 RepID=UPI003666E10F
MSRTSSTKPHPTRSAPKKTAAPARAVLPVRPHTDTEFITEHQMAAAYTARLAELPLIPITAWTPQPDGSVRAVFPSGASLTCIPGATGFDALTPCPQGAVHHARITAGTQLREAAAAAAHCTQLHGRPRILTLAQADTTAADTQALTRNDIDTGLAARNADEEKPKENPQS